MRRLALVLVAAAAVPRVARADDYSIHVLGNVQTSWSDNLFSAPDDDDPDTAAPESDLYTQLRPGALVSYETPRSIYQLTYDLEANLYASHTEAWSLTHLASWHGFFLTSPRTELQASASFSSGTLNSLVTRAPTAMQAPQQQLGGSNAFWGLEAGQSLSFTMTRELRLSQGLRARRFSTSDASGDSGGTELGLNGGVDRGWARSALAFQLSGALVTLERASESNATINGNAIVSYRRDLSPRWTALVDGGLAAVLPVDGGDKFVQPTVGTNIGYTPNWGQATLSIRRAMAPNLYIAQNTITDSATLSASLPLPWLTEDANRPKLTTQGAIGISRTRQIIGDSLDAATDVANIDLSLQYNPRPGIGFALRGQHLRQVSEDVPTSMLATRTADYDRTTIMLSATWRFPDRLAAEIPVRDSLRVDRGGNTPVGEEVAPSQAP